MVRKSVQAESGRPGALRKRGERRRTVTEREGAQCFARSAAASAESAA